MCIQPIEKFFLSGPLLFEIEKHDLLSDTGVYLIDLINQTQDFHFGNSRLAGIHFQFDVDIVLRKKLLGPATGSSSGPMIAAIHSCHVFAPLGTSPGKY